MHIQTMSQNVKKFLPVSARAGGVDDTWPTKMYKKYVDYISIWYTVNINNNKPIIFIL